MTIANWIASDTASWIFSALGLLATALLVAGARLRRTAEEHEARMSGSDYPWSYRRRRSNRSSLIRLTAWLPAVVGALLVVGGAVLVGLQVGRLSWLIALSGVACLLVFAFLQVETAWSWQMERALVHQHRMMDQVSRKIDRKVNEMVDAAVSLHSPPPRLAQPPSPEVIAESVVQHLRRQGVLRPTTAELVEALTQHMIGKGLLRGNLADTLVSAGRWAPVSIYTSADDGADLKDAVLTVLREFGLELAAQEPHVRGSWFQRLWARGRDVAESTPMRERLAKLERAVELEALGKRQAEIDKTKAEAVSALLEVVKDQKNAIVRLGSIIVIKTEGDLVVWTIGEMEAADLEKNSALLRDPVAALKFLRGSEKHKPASLDPPRDGDALRG